MSGYCVLDDYDEMHNHPINKTLKEICLIKDKNLRSVGRPSL